MIKYFEGTNLAWDTEAGVWLKEKKAQVETSDFSFEIETQHFMDYLRDSQDADGGRMFKSDFHNFDEHLEGIETGEVIVISGHAKNGKTLFAESWLRSMMLRDPECKCIFFSFEVKTKKLLIKYLDDKKLPLYVPKNLKTMDFKWLLDHCKQAKEKNGCSVVLIDHLHFMVDMNTKQNMSLNIGAFMRRLKHDIAIGLDMAVILVAHQGQVEKGKEASINTIRDSSFIGQEADSIIMVNRRKNLDPVEFMDFKIAHGEEKADKLSQKTNSLDDDSYSHGLAVVTIERARRSGVFEYKKMFKKLGQFLEEL